MIYLRLFWEFFKTGLFAIGGGMATLPFLHDIGEATGWFTQAQLMNMLAVSESTPGPIGVNMATYVGFSTGGVGGALIATLGLITPSVIVILIVAAFLKAFRDSKWVSAAFYGLRPASTALVAAAGISVVRRWLACEVSMPYALYEPVRAAVAALGGVVQETQYAAAVTLCALLPEEAGEAFAAQVRDLTAGRCAVRPVGETERAVPLADTGL